MPAETLNFINLILILVVLFIVFDTIKRIKGTFNRGWKALFFAFSLLFVLELAETLGILFSIDVELGEVLGEILQIIFYAAIIISVAVINRKVRELTDHHLKKKYRK